MLNACDSGATGFSSERPSLPRAFMDLGGAAIIASELPIRANVAEEMTDQTMKNLSSGMPIGDALYHAKLHLMEKRKMPTTLFYTSYGDTARTLNLPFSEDQIISSLSKGGFAFTP